MQLFLLQVTTRLSSLCSLVSYIKHWLLNKMEYQKRKISTKRMHLFHILSIIFFHFHPEHPAPTPPPCPPMLYLSYLSPSCSCAAPPHSPHTQGFQIWGGWGGTHPHQGVVPPMETCPPPHPQNIESPPTVTLVPPLNLEFFARFARIWPLSFFAFTLKQMLTILLS